MKKIALGDFLTARTGKYKPTDEAVVNLQRIDKIDFSGNIHLSDRMSNTDMILIHPGDLVISGINVSKGALNIYQGGESVSATIHYSAYAINNKKIDVEYLKQFLKSPAFVQLLKDKVKGGIKTEIKAKHILPLEIPLPSLSQQRQILRTVNRQTKSGFRLAAELTTQQEIIKNLRQAFLREAIRGELTAQWRLANPKVESAATLLKKITTQKTGTKTKPQPPLTPAETPHPLPPTWTWVPATYPATLLSDKDKKINLTEILNDGKFPVVDQGKMFIRGYCNDENKVIKINSPIILFGDHTREIKLIDFDFVVGADGVKLLHPIAVNPEYYEISLKCCVPASRGYGRHFKILKSSYIPLPPLAEQKAIVAKVSQRLKLCDELEAHTNQNQTTTAALTQTTLQENFPA